jgi:hypothetical protein
MRFLTIALCGALFTAGAGRLEAQGQKQQVDTARAAANMQRGMRGGIFFENGKKPTKRIAQGAGGSSSPPVAQVYLDGGPLPVPTYRLPNGVVLQASDGMNPGDGVTCIAYCEFQVITRWQPGAALAR